MHSRHRIFLAAALLVVLASCAKQPPDPDPFASVLCSLAPASISDISVSGSSDDSRPLTVTPDQWPSLLKLLQPLQPALDVRVEPPSSSSAADWQSVGSITPSLFVSRLLPPCLMNGRHSSVSTSPSIQGHTPSSPSFSSRDQLMLPYRGSAFRPGFCTRLRGARPRHAADSLRSPLLPDVRPLSMRRRHAFLLGCLAVVGVLFVVPFAVVLFPQTFHQEPETSVEVAGSPPVGTLSRRSAMAARSVS